MTLNKLASELCKREGKKSQVAIGNMRETLGHLADIWYAEVIENDWALDLSQTSATDVALYLAGEKRAKKAKRK